MGHSENWTQDLWLVTQYKKHLAATNFCSYSTAGDIFSAWQPIMHKWLNLGSYFELQTTMGSMRTSINKDGCQAPGHLLSCCKVVEFLAPFLVPIILIEYRWFQGCWGCLPIFVYKSLQHVFIAHFFCFSVTDSTIHSSRPIPNTVFCGLPFSKFWWACIFILLVYCAWFHAFIVHACCK